MEHPRALADKAAQPIVTGSAGSKPVQRPSWIMGSQGMQESLEPLAQPRLAVLTGSTQAITGAASSAP